MASMINLKRRIKSIQNTKQITKAMELVAASKMRKAQDRAKLSRDYQEAAYDLLARLYALDETKDQPLFVKRTPKIKLYIAITSNTGLAGAYNYNVLKLLNNEIKSNQESKIKTQVITVGKRGAQYIRRLHNIEQVAVYPMFSDQPSPNDIRPILNTITDLYRTEKIDEANIIYTKFVNNFIQKAEKLVILPAFSSENDLSLKYQYSFSNFEPSVEAVIDSAALRLIEVQIWQALLESIASEHSMRMLAMKAATDNADNLVKDYTLEFNTVRQASITQDLAEITAGAEAMKG